MVASSADCAMCGALISAPPEPCQACGGDSSSVTYPGTAHPAIRQEQRAGGADDPGILITARDFMVLEDLARFSMRPADAVTRLLIDKLERCRVLPPGTLPKGVVTLNSRVLFRVDEHPAEARVLVHPDDVMKSGWTLSAVSLRGLALLGRSAGSAVEVEQRDGSRERISILSVMHQLVVRSRQGALPASMAPRPQDQDLTGAMDSRWPAANDDLPPPAA
ncbi:hypothetical protein [Roseomonas xinghualingensis]|uniref:hypothetical protein n=2 Tax=Roseomonas xinghualingensis TaxID=2986475 RepID=UPI003671F0E1